MKNLKIRTVFLLLLCMIIVFNSSTYYVQADEVKERIVTEEYAQKQRENDLLRYGEREEVTIVNTEYYTTRVFVPDGQPTKGTSFEYGGYVYIRPNSGPSIDFSVSLAWEMISFSIAMGSYSAKSTADGTGVYIPGGNIPYLVTRQDTNKFDRHRVDVYQYNTYQYTYYTTVRSLSRTDYMLRDMTYN